MRSDIRDHFEFLNKKNKEGDLREEDRLQFMKELTAYCDVWCFASDRMMKLSKSFEEEAKEYSMIRNLVGEMKNGADS